MHFITKHLLQLFICCNLISIDHSHAQDKVILFQNIFSGEQVELHEGDDVHLRFTVHDTADAPLDVAISDVTLTGTIEFINDSSILLVLKNKTFDRVSVVVFVNSIEAFRKYSPFRPVLKAASTVVAASSALLVSLQISSSDEVLSLQNVALAIGTAAAAFASKELFSDRMKYFMVEGWRGTVVSREMKKKNLESRK